MPHPFPQKSKNSEERRVAKLRTEKVTLEAGLGRPRDGSWSQPGPTTRMTAYSGRKGEGREDIWINCANFARLF